MGGGIPCPYCSSTLGRCATTASGRSVTECGSCGRVVEERQTQLHDLFLLRAHDSPLCLVTPDLSSVPSSTRRHDHKSSATPTPTAEKDDDEEEDPFEPTGFITAFSTASLEPTPIFASSCLSFSGHLAELERALDSSSSASSGPVVVVDNLRAYLQIIDVSSILGLDYDISDHAFQLFRDCSAATCLRNRSVEALATAALVQAIREAQEPRTLQEISIAANLPQKEIGKYIKILGEALQLSQPINSNSISVHMPRFCTLLQLNKSAQELATHIGEVVINKCFCTRRNPISISAAAIYLACQLEDKRKTQAEICKVTGLTEVTLRKVYKELLENWDDLLPPNYTPAVPPEKAFPTTAITSGRSLTPRSDHVEVASSLEKNKQPEVSLSDKPSEISEMDHQTKGKEEAEIKGNTWVPPKLSSAPYVANNVDHYVLNQGAKIWHTQLPFGMPISKPTGEEKIPISSRGIDINEAQTSPSESEQRVDNNQHASITTNQKSSHFPVPSASNESSNLWPFHHQAMSGSGSSSHVRFVQAPKILSGLHELKGMGNQNKHLETDHSRDAEKP